MNSENKYESKQVKYSKKYKDEAILDEEDKYLVRILQTVGYMKSGTHIEMDDTNGTIQSKETARTTKLGRDVLRDY